MFRFQQFFAEKSFSGGKKLLLATIIIASAVVSATAAGSDRATLKISAAHTLARSSCSGTLYPELCYSAIAASIDGGKKVESDKDVIFLSLNVTIVAVQRNYAAIGKLIAGNKSNFTKWEKLALKDYLETLDETLDELETTVKELNEYPFKKSIEAHADDLKTLLSSAITNQRDRQARTRSLHRRAGRSRREALQQLARDADQHDEERKLNGRRRLAEGVWPEWMSVVDRRLLQSTTVTPDAVVAADGSGDYKTVAEAVAAAPEKSKTRYVIRIKAGVYKENVEVSKKKTNIMFVGDGRTTTIITATKNVVDGSTTFKSATVAVVGEKFLARDITFQNTAEPSKHQAVALRVGSDLSAFYKCDILAYQDTLYVHSNRNFFINCLIAGTVDSIFGNAASVLQDCDIHARRPNSGKKNMVTTHGRTDPNQNTGIVIQKSRIGATSDLQSV
ncbi:hypothetical protein SASPL_139361 [Salvia splendens]|uniref:Pectinesterase n=1 Tax=Salvia splendens TaxID=180675 RepID=A0A8X8WND3_SALSN|nr:hypothetical protein SASPL_139361 [Salvia splendens]